MTTKKIPRYKVIHCQHTSHPGKVIARIDRNKYPRKHVPADVILSKIRRHYKKEHPQTFKQWRRRKKR